MHAREDCCENPEIPVLYTKRRFFRHTVAKMKICITTMKRKYVWLALKNNYSYQDLPMVNGVFWAQENHPNTVDSKDGTF